METKPTVSTLSIYKTLWEGVRPYKGLYFTSLSCFTLSVILTNIVPIFYKQFFDALGSSKKPIESTPILIHILGVILILHLIQWLFSRVGNRSQIAMQTYAMARLKQNAFNYMVKHSHNFFANNFTGSLVQRVNRFSRALERLADTIIYNIIPLFVTVTAAIIVTWQSAPVVSFVIAGWVLILVIFNFFFARWRYQFDLASTAADSKATGVLADNITNQSAISLFTSYTEESSYYKEVTDDQAAKSRYSWNLGDLTDTIQIFLIYVVEFIVFYYAVLFWSRGEATIGTFVLIQIYIIGLAHQLWGLNRIIRGIYESMADSREMVEIMSLPYEIQDSPQAKELKVQSGQIDFDHLSFNFNENRSVLSDINLTIKGGEKVALVGPSGAGKTTFVRLILRFYESTAGAIKIDGQNIKEVTQDSLREHISLVPQDPVLFHRTLMDNIRYGRRDATDEEVLRAARLAHCDEFIEALPLKYETFVGERGIKLSGGERQRVAIARAILKDAPILILDEATSSLDSHSEALIQDALDTLMKGRTTIVIAHRLSTIRKMDTIIVMENGSIREQGSHEELTKKKDSLYQKLWELQAGGFIQD